MAVKYILIEKCVYLLFYYIYSTVKRCTVAFLSRLTINHYNSLKESINYHMTAQTPFDFSHFLSKVLKNPQEINLIQANYQKNVALIKESIKIPKNLPSSQEISKFFVFLNEMQKTKKSVSLKSFFIKTKVFLIWLISVYELFSQKTLEIFVKP